MREHHTDPYQRRQPAHEGLKQPAKNIDVANKETPPKKTKKSTTTAQIHNQTAANPNSAWHWPRLRSALDCGEATPRRLKSVLTAETKKERNLSEPAVAMAAMIPTQTNSMPTREMTTTTMGGNKKSECAAQQEVELGPQKLGKSPQSSRNHTAIGPAME